MYCLYLYYIYILLLIAAMIIINCLLEHFIKVLSLFVCPRTETEECFSLECEEVESQFWGYVCYRILSKMGILTIFV